MVFADLVHATRGTGEKTAVLLRPATVPALANRQVGCHWTIASYDIDGVAMFPVKQDSLSSHPASWDLEMNKPTKNLSCTSVQSICEHAFMKSHIKI